jgi:hypothetical protein
MARETGPALVDINGNVLRLWKGLHGFPTKLLPGGQIVWQIGPGYDRNASLKELGWIIGQHHAHMIPKGLPGAGNIPVFDNGGFGGYGSPNPGAPTGHNNALRDYSRVLEFDPTTLKIVRQYTYVAAGHLPKMGNSKFYSPLISSAERCLNYLRYLG